MRSSLVRCWLPELQAPQPRARQVLRGVCFSFAAVPPRAKEQRKTVTVLLCDLADSTALGETLDPERLRALLARYFEQMKAIVERHGGSVAQKSTAQPPRSQ